MQIPTLPTDNLYKFICFAGLSLFIISPIYYQLFSHQVFLKNMDLRLEMALTKEKVAILEKETDKLENDVKKTEKTDTQTRLQEFKNLGDILKQKMRDMKIDRIRMDRLAEEVFYLNKKHKLLKTVSILGFLVGLFFFGIGLYFWYTKIQIHEDRIIKKRAEKQEIE